MVEAAGIEPASVSPLPVALHAYSVFMFSPSQPGRQGARCSDSGEVLAVPPRTSFRAILWESTPGTWTHKHGFSQTAPYWVLSSECVVVVVGN